MPLVLDGTTGFNLPVGAEIGVGTDTPAGNGLHVDHTAGATLRLTRLGTSTSHFVQLETDGAHGTLRSEGNLTLQSGGANPRITVLSTGNVGIGTTSPATKLQVNHTSNNGFITNVGVAGQYSGIKFARGTGTGGGAGSNNNWGLVVSDNGLEFSTFTSAGDNVTGRSAKMSISADGNAGIGITSPGTRLQVAGTQNVPSGTSKGMLLVRADGSSHGLQMGVTGSAPWGSWIQAQDNNISSAYPLILQPGGGNVGIGTTSPLAMLDISGNTTTYDGMAKIYLTDSNGNSSSRNWSIGNGGSAFGNLTFAVSAAKDGVAGDSSSVNTMVIQPSGNVGIGTTNPTAKLDVNGNIVISNASSPPNVPTNYDQLYLGDRSQIYNRSGLGLSISTNNEFGGSPTHKYQVNGSAGLIEMFGNSFKYYNAATGTAGASPSWINRLTILANGNVGIGTDDPSRKLVLYDASAPYMAFQNSSTGTAAGDGLQVQMAGLHGYVFNYESGDLYLGSGGATRITIKSDGNVGIGTTNPSAPLMIRQNTSDAYTATNYNNVPTLTLMSNNGNTNYTGIRFTNSVGNYEQFLGTVQTSANSADMVIQGHDRSASAYKEYMRVKDSGAIDTPLQPACMIYCQAVDINWDVGDIIGYGTGNSIKAFDTTNSFNMSNYTYTAPEDGKYYVSFTCNGVAYNNQTPRAYPRVNGTTLGRGQHARGNSTITGDLDMRTYSGIITMSANDTLNVYVGVGRWDTFGCNYFCVYKML